MNYTKEVLETISNVSVESMNLSVRVKNVFGKFNISTIGDLEKHFRYIDGHFVRLILPGLGVKSIKEIEDEVVRLVEASGQNIAISEGVDKLIKPVKFNLIENLPNIKIDEIFNDNLTTRMRNGLKTSGIVELSDLNGRKIKEIRSWPNIGKKSFDKFEALLSEFSLEKSEEAEELVINCWLPFRIIEYFITNYDVKILKTVLAFEQYSDVVKSLPSELASIYSYLDNRATKIKNNIILNKKVENLKLPIKFEYVIREISEMLIWDKYKEDISNICATGKINPVQKQVLVEISKLVQLGLTTYKTGWVDNSFQRNIGIFDHELIDYKKSISMLNDLTESSLVNKIIITDRILKDDLESSTLQQIGDNANISLTRERIRQIEKKLSKKIGLIARNNHYYQIEILEKHFSRSRIININDYEKNVYFDDLFENFPSNIHFIFYFFSTGVSCSVRKEGDFLIDYKGETITKFGKYQNRIMKLTQEALNVTEDYPSIDEIAYLSRLDNNELKYALHLLNIDWVANKVIHESPNKPSIFIKKKIHSMQGTIAIDDLVREYDLLVEGDFELNKRNILAHLERAQDVIRLGVNNDLIGRYSEFIPESLEQEIKDRVLEILRERETGLSGPIILKKLKTEICLNDLFSQYSLVDVLRKHVEFRLGRKAFIALRTHKEKPKIRDLVNSYLEDHPEASVDEILNESGVREFYSDYSVLPYLKKS